MHRLFFACSMAPIDEPQVYSILRFAAAQGFEIVLPDRLSAVETLAASLAKCTGVWGLVLAGGGTVDSLDVELRAAIELGKPVALFIEQGIAFPEHWSVFRPILFDRNDLAQLQVDYVHWLTESQSSPPSSEGNLAPFVLGAVAAGLVFYWLSRKDG